MQTAEDLDIDFSGNEALQNTLAYVDDLFGADLPFSPGLTFVGARFTDKKKRGSGEVGPVFSLPEPQTLIRSAPCSVASAKSQRPFPSFPGSGGTALPSFLKRPPMRTLP